MINFLDRTSLTGSSTELFPDDDAFLLRLLYKSQNSKSAPAAAPLLLPANEEHLLWNPDSLSLSCLSLSFFVF